MFQPTIKSSDNPQRSIIANLLRMLFTLCVKGDYLYMSGGFCKYLVRTFLKQFCIPCSSEQGIHEYLSLTHGYSYMPCAAPADSTGAVRHHTRRRHGRSQSAGAQAYNQCQQRLGGRQTQHADRHRPDFAQKPESIKSKTRSYHL